MFSYFLFYAFSCLLMLVGICSYVFYLMTSLEVHFIMESHNELKLNVNSKILN